MARRGILKVKAVLVLTQQFDPTGDLVIHGLHDAGVPVQRVHIGDFPVAASLVAAAGRDGRFSGEFYGASGVFDLASVGAVYYRRPEQFRLSPGIVVNRDFALAEARVGLGGVLRSLPCLWLSHPDAIVRAQYKPEQLTAAAALGLSVPRTLVTNDPEAAREFVNQCRDGAIYKTLSTPIVRNEAGRRAAVMTTHITTQDVEARAAEIRLTACQFQERLDKRFEYRVTVVGETVFATRIDSQRSSVTELDFRKRFEDLPCEPAELPPLIADACRSLVAHYGLQYGNIDLVETPDGELVFLEINPNGQWAWVDPDTTEAIRRAIVDLLVDAVSSPGGVSSLSSPSSPRPAAEGGHSR
jgi:ATP-grasp ribosomal peptide maturase